jgi:hypothetical protein
VEPYVIALVVVAVLAAVCFVIRYARRTELRRLEAWSEWADRRGFAFHGEEGPWYKRKAARIEGQRGAVSFVLDTFVVSTGKSSIAFTRASSKLPPASRERARMRIVRNGFFSRLRRHFGAEFVPSGDPEFDAKFLIDSDDSIAVAHVFDAKLRTGLSAFAAQAKFRHWTIGGDASVLVWLGTERSPERLDEALALACGAIANSSAARSNPSAASRA